MKTCKDYNGPVTLENAHMIQKSEIKYFISLNKSDNIGSEHKRGLQIKIHWGCDSDTQIMQCNPQKGSIS